MFWGKKLLVPSSAPPPPEPSAVRRSIPPPPPSSRAHAPAPAWPSFQVPHDATVRSLECWSNHGCAGDRFSDAYAARAALAAGCRYGLNRFGRLVFVFIDSKRHGNGGFEHAVQDRSPGLTRKTLQDDTATFVLSAQMRKLK